MEIKKGNSKLTIVIATYNNEETIKKCLLSISEQEKAKGLEVEIILIDNNSQDETWKVLKSLSKEHSLTLYKNSFNNGFGRTINQVIKKHTYSDFYLILNPDAYLDKKAIKELFGTITQEKELGLLSCKIVDPKSGAVLFENGKIDFLRFKTTHETTNKQNRCYLTGCALLITKELIDKIGIFDPKFFLYYEDADLSKRTLDAGFKIKTAKNAICYHNESHSSTSLVKNYFLTRNALYFFKKHYHPLALPYFWLCFFIRFAYHKNFSRKANISKAMLDFLHS